jgi:hypothetical protein
MQHMPLHHTEMVGELAALWAVVSVLGRSPSDTFCVEVEGELAAEYKKMEDRCSRLE